MRLTPRDYQVEAIEAVHKAWAGGMRRPAVVLPTGAGKTIPLAELARDVVYRHRADGTGGRALVLAHRPELVDQAISKLRANAPDLRIGRVQGNTDQVGADVVVGMVQTLRHDARLRRVRNVRAIVVDECHHATAASYRKILGHYGAIVDETSGDRRALALGLTATMSRGDKSALGDIWEDVVYKKSIAWMIRKGYLVEPKGIMVRVEDLNLAKIKKTAGDYQLDELGEALTQSLAPKRIIEAFLKHAADRPTLLFSPTVAFAELMCEEFRAAGVTAAVVHGNQGHDERAAVLEDFKAKRVQVLCNCMVLTEGTDLPLAACCVIARATTHQGLYVQMVGRVLRPDPFSGKVDALVLDVAGASRKHALSTQVDLLGIDDDTEDVDDRDELLDDMLAGDAEDAGDEPPEYADGSLVTEVVDLFHGARSAWNTTYAGVHYIAAGERFIALVPGLALGEWDIVSISKKPGNQWNPGSWWIDRGIADLGYAMAGAEDDVSASEATLAHRDRRWRKAPATQKMLDRAYRMRLIVPAGATGDTVSQMIDKVTASERIDANLAPYMRARLG